MIERISSEFEIYKNRSQIVVDVPLYCNSLFDRQGRFDMGAVKPEHARFVAAYERARKLAKTNSMVFRVNLCLAFPSWTFQN